MTAQSTFPMTDLILRLTGGERDGELIPVNTKKCFLGMEENRNGIVDKAQCAIFRGPQGAAVRSYGDEILVNGVSTTVHWLKEGDRIEFPNRMTVEVAQLGWVDLSCNELESVVTELDQTIVDQTIAAQAIVDQAIAQQTSEEQEETGCKSETCESEQPHSCQDAYHPADANAIDTDDSESFMTMGSREPATQENEEEKIVAYDPGESDDAPISETAMNIEIKDAIPELNGISQDEVNARLLEMERVLGGQLAGLETETENQPQLEPGTSFSDSFDAESFMSQTANEQFEKTFEPLSHSLDENVASFADNSTPLEPVANDSCEPSFDSSLGGLVSEIEEEFPVKEIPVMETPVMETPVEETPVEETIEQPEPTTSAPKDESVSELLARMKSEGQWDGIPDEGEDVHPVESVESEPEPVSEFAHQGEAAGEDNVEDYMSQLLSRMRGDEPAVSQPKPVHRPKPGKPAAVETPQEEAIVPPVDPLKAEDFKPSRKAKPIGSLSAMRELANSSARSAVHKSEKTRKKALGVAQMGIAFASFLMAAYYMLVDSVELFDTGFIVGVVCLLIAGYLCFRSYMTMRNNELVAARPKSDKKNSADDDQADEAENEK